jgi:hypothetical protein
MHVGQLLFYILPILLLRYAIHTYRCLLANPIVGTSERFHVNPDDYPNFYRYCHLLSNGPALTGRSQR